MTGPSWPEASQKNPR